MWNYFNYDNDVRLACRCCGRKEMNDDFMRKLDLLREQYGKPISITSGFRCADYNSKISSTGKNGAHTTGRAVDIACSTSRERSELMRLLLHPDSPFTRVTPAKNFIHIDDLTAEDGFTENVMWWYG